MSLFLRAYTLLTHFCSNRIISTSPLAKYFQCAVPWMYEQILIHLRSDDKEKVLTLKQYKETNRQLFINWVLVWLNRFQLLFAPKSDILFMTSNPNHHAQYVTLEPLFKEKGITWVYITNKLKIYQELIRKKKRVYFLDNANKNYLNRFYVNTTNTPDFEKAMELHVQRNMGYFRYLEKQLRWMIYRLSPKVFVTANELLVPHRIALILFKENSLQTICLQHGHFGSNNVIYKELLSNHFLVYGQLSKQAMLNMGFPENRIQVVGSLLYNDTLPHFAPSTQSFLSSGKKNILVVFSGAGNSTSLLHHLKQIQTVDALANEMEDVNFLVKLHPKDSIQYYQGIHRNNIRVVSHVDFMNQKGDFIDVIARSNAVITSVSTSIYDAFKLGVPVCVLDLENEYSDSDVTQSKVVSYCNSFDKLLNSIREMIKHDGTYATIQPAKKYLIDFYNLTEKTDTKTLVYQVISQSILTIIKDPV
jgi:hypothetical protein